MKKWIHRQISNKQNNSLMYQNRNEPEEQQKEMEAYLATLYKAQTPTKTLHIPYKKMLILGSIITLILGTVVYIFLGKGNLLSTTSPNASSMDTYLTMEKAYVDSFDKHLLKGTTLMETLRSKDTHWKGNMDINFLPMGFYVSTEPMDSSTPQKISSLSDFHYDIDAYLTKSFATATLDLNLNDIDIGSGTYFKYAKDSNTYMYYPQYSARPVDTTLTNPDINSLLSSELTTLYPFIKTFYPVLIEKLAKEGDLNYEKETQYKVGSLSTTCDSYTLTLNKKQMLRILDAQYTGFFMNENTNQTTFLSFIQKILLYIRNKLMEDNEQKDTDPFFHMTVYYKENNILGRTLTLNFPEGPVNINIGSLLVEDEWVMDCSVLSNTFFNVNKKLFSFQVNANNFHDTYNGSFSIAFGETTMEGVFSKFSMYSNNSIFPISGEVSANISYGNESAGYPTKFSAKIINANNKLKLTAQLTNEAESGNYNFEYSSSSFASVYLTGSLDLTAEVVDEIDMKLPATTVDNVINDWESFADAVSEQPVERLLNNYCKALYSDTLFTRPEAITMIKKGGFYPLVPNVSKLLDSYNYGSSYHYDMDYDIIQDENLAPAYINFLGDYSSYNVYDVPYYNENMKEAIKDVKKIPQKHTFETTMDETLDKIIDTISKNTTMFFAGDETSTSVTLMKHGNIFKGTHALASTTSVVLRRRGLYTYDNMSSESLTINYDTFTNKIMNIYLELPVSNLEPFDFTTLSCELAHILEPSRTTKEYLTLLTGSGTINGHIENDNGVTMINIYSHVNTTGPNNIREYYQSLDISHQNN